MKDYYPEGVLINSDENKKHMTSEASLITAHSLELILEASVTMCDADHNLIVDLGVMKGIIPREEGALGIKEGKTRDIALMGIMLAIIEVAKLAGLPDSIIKRAKKILKELENNSKGSNNAEALLNLSKEEPEEEMQLSLMPSANNAISDKLSSIDINTLTPIEAMNLLYELKNMI